jgi:thiol-disulfide isomerase/thioredoxin
MPTIPRRSLITVTGLLVAACASASGTPAGSATAPTPPPTPVTSPAGSDGTGSPLPVAVDRPWATAELVDVSTGQPFRIADLVADGKVVFVETMAIWCTNCRAQQADAMTALGQLDRSKVAWIGLDVDPSEMADALAAYGPRWGFDFTYALAGTEVARALVDDFGDLVISPPSTPIVVVGTDGTVTLTDYGHKSVDQIVQLAVAHGA